MIAATGPEVTVRGIDNVVITDGDNKASVVDGTHFGTIAQGGAPFQRTFTVRNDGDLALNLGSMNVPAGFTLVEGLPSSLAAGEEDTFTVRLDADIAGTKSGHLSFTTNDDDEPLFNFRVLGKVL